MRHRIDPEPSFSGHDLQSGGAVEGNDSGDGAPPRRRARLADAIEEYVARQRNDPESSGLSKMTYSFSLEGIAKQKSMLDEISSAEEKINCN